MQIVFLHFAFKVLLPNIISSLSIFFLNVTDLITTLGSCLITCPAPYNFWKIVSCPNNLPVSCPSSSPPLWFFLEYQGNFVMTHGLQNGFSSGQFSHSVMSDSFRPHGLQRTRLPCSSPTPRAYSNSCPSSQWCHPIISSSCPLFLLPSSPPIIRVFPNESALRIMAKVLEFQLQHQSFQWIPRTDLL